MKRGCAKVLQGVLLFSIFFLTLLPFSLAQECIEPLDGMQITQSATFCAGEYAAKVTIRGEGIVLRCDGTVFKGDGEGAAITIQSSERMRLSECVIEGFEIGVRALDSSQVVLNANTIRNNKIGVALERSEGDVQGNIFENNGRDVESLQEPNEEASQDAPKEQKPTVENLLQSHVKVLMPSAQADQIQDEVERLITDEFAFARGRIEVERTFFYDEAKGQTTITLIIRPSEGLSDVKIIESIPKCVASYIDELSFAQNNFKVVERDPIILWSFSDVSIEQKVSYTAFKRLSEECKALFVDVALASAKDEARTLKGDEAAKGKGRLAVVFGIFVFSLVLLFALKRRKG